jgi:hypothetical protein
VKTGRAHRPRGERSRLVFDLEVELRQAQPPPRKAALSFRQVHYPSEGVMIHSHGEAVPFQIRP